MELIEFASICAERWKEKTLQEFRAEAMSKDSGIIYDAMRQKDGQRALLLVCTTGTTALEELERKIDLGNEGDPADWRKLTLVELVMRSTTAGGLCYESLLGEDGKRSAIILCASTPEMAIIIGDLFSLPR